MNLPATLLNVLSCCLLTRAIPSFTHTVPSSRDALTQVGCVDSLNHSGPGSKSSPQTVIVHKNYSKHNANYRGTKLCSK